MGLFTNYTAPGPGIPKDLPPKKGLALFFATLGRELWTLVKLNLLFVLFSIPIVTIGPAYAAMTRLTTKMVWDQNIYLLSDFWSAFKKDWKRTVPTGIVTGILFLALFVAIQFYSIQSKENIIFLFIFVISMFLLLLFSLAYVYIYPLIVNVDLDMKNVIRNAFLLGIACVRDSLICTILCGSILLLTYWFFPLSMPLALFISFSLVSLINSFAAWAGIKKYVVKIDAQAETVE